MMKMNKRNHKRVWNGNGKRERTIHLESAVIIRIATVQADKGIFGENVRLFIHVVCCMWCRSQKKPWRIRSVRCATTNRHLRANGLEKRRISWWYFEWVCVCAVNTNAEHSDHHCQLIRNSCYVFSHSLDITHSNCICRRFCFFLHFFRPVDIRRFPLNLTCLICIGS